jgi:Ca2+-binding EF-hand superfamily protein
MPIATWTLALNGKKSSTRSRHLKEKFDAIDEDGSGELDEEEMRALFASMEHKCVQKDHCKYYEAERS